MDSEASLAEGAPECHRKTKASEELLGMCLLVGRSPPLELGTASKTVCRVTAEKAGKICEKLQSASSKPSESEAALD